MTATTSILFDQSKKLLAAAKEGKYEVVKSMLDKFKEENDANKLPYTKEALINSEDAEGNTALILAITNNHDDVAKYLISNGAKLFKDEEYSALHVAVYANSLELVKFILGKNIELLEKKIVDLTPLGLAVNQNKTDIANFLVEKGANVNEINSRGNNLFHEAVSVFDSTPIFKLLMGKGARVDLLNKKNKDGKSPMELAIQFGTIYKKLLQDYLDKSPEEKPAENKENTDGLKLNR